MSIVKLMGMQLEISENPGPIKRVTVTRDYAPGEIVYGYTEGHITYYHYFDDEKDKNSVNSVIVESGEKFFVAQYKNMQELMGNRQLVRLVSKLRETLGHDSVTGPNWSWPTENVTKFVPFLATLVRKEMVKKEEVFERVESIDI